jgi:nucleoside-diphosphate-sugar epimerase
MQPTPVHAVIGAGQIGALLIDELLGRGLEVRVARRGGSGAPRPNLTWMRGDITDPAFADQVCGGAAVVYNCTNAPYHRWDDMLRPLYRGIREAAARAGARLVVLDNLYAIGRPATAPFDDDAPLEPCSRKGEIRAELHRERFEAHRRGDLEVTAGRASDFVGVDSAQAAVFSPRAFSRMLRGRAVEVLGDPDMPHSYNAVTDVARQLAILGTSDASWGRMWNLPAVWNGTTRGLLEAIAAGFGIADPPIKRHNMWLLAALGLVIRPLSGVAEMVYQWEVPYVLDGSRFVDTFADPAPNVDDLVARIVSAWSEKTAASAA